ncbi:hypothetical protein V8F06_005616 [Rhypophila decipiens]
MLPSSTIHELEHISHKVELITHRLEPIIHQLKQRELAFHQLEFTAAKMVPKPKPKQQSWFDEGWFEQNSQQKNQCSTVGSGTSTSPINTPPESLPEYRSSAVAKSMFAKAFGPVMPSTTPIHIPVTRDATPYPGETFIILHKPSNRAITLYKDGIVGLGDVHSFSSDPETQNTDTFLSHCHRTGNRNSCSVSRCQWLCVERNGWLGFRALTGEYMGHGTLTNIVKEEDRHVVGARHTRHEESECCCVRRHPRGGYILMIRDQNTKLLKVEIRTSTLNNLVLREDGGALWEFVKVDGICC